MLSAQAAIDLQCMNKQLRTQNESQKRSLALKDQELAHLKRMIDALKLKLFGSGKSERVDSNQLLLLLEGLEAELKDQDPPKNKSVSGYEREEGTGQSQARHPLPDDLEEVIEELIPDEVEANPEAYEFIGVTETQELDLIPAKFIKRIIRRFKYKRKDDLDGPVLIARLPGRVIGNGIPGVGLVVQVLLSKYVDHLPLYRQEQIYKRRFGVYLSRKTMSDWVQVVAEQWLSLIYYSIKNDLLSSDYLQADETPIQCLDKTCKGKTRRGWLWVYSRPHGDLLYDWQLSRSANSLRNFIKGFSGVLQSDGYSAYDVVAKEEGLEQAGCWAHARRYFFQSWKAGQEQSLKYLYYIRELYRHEKYIREEGLEPSAYRKLKSVPVLADIKALLDSHNNIAKGVQPELYKAVNYTLSQWNKLNCYIEHDEVQIDNNYAEQGVRPTKLGAKNWLFIGHPEAGKRSAIIYTIVESCKRHGIEPQEYLTDVLTKLPNMTNHQAKEANLVPRLWKSKRSA